MAATFTLRTATVERTATLSPVFRDTQIEKGMLALSTMVAAHRGQPKTILCTFGAANSTRNPAVVVFRIFCTE